jgi:hypothetical protein
LLTAMATAGARIQAKAADLDPARVLLGMLALPLLAVGWLAYWTWRLVWLIATWAWAAVLVGWREAAGTPDDTSGGGG